MQGFVRAEIIDFMLCDHGACNSIWDAEKMASLGNG